MSVPTSTITSTHTIVLKPGEVFNFPDGAQLIYASDTSALESDCMAIPDTTYKCGYFYLVLDQDSNSGHAMDESHVYLKELTVGGAVYDLQSTLVITSGYNPGTVITTTTLNSLLPDTSLFKFTSVSRDTGPDKRQYVSMYFKVIDTFYDSILLKVNNWESVQYYKSQDEADCPS